MKIELKDIHYHIDLSRESDAFTADIFIEDRKAARVANDGFTISIRPWKQMGWTLIAAAVEYCKTLPKEGAFFFPEDAKKAGPETLEEHTPGEQNSLIIKMPQLFNGSVEWNRANGRKTIYRIKTGEVNPPKKKKEKGLRH